MRVGRNRVLLILTLGASVLLTPAFAFGKEDSEHKHKDGHEHAAMMKAEKKIAAALARLPDADRKAAAAQRFCPVMEYSRLGSDGTPIKLTIKGKPVFVCCKGCVKKASKNSDATLAKAKKLAKAAAGLQKLPMADRVAAETQKFCAIANKNYLGSMGAPLKLTIEGKPVYLCCKGCAGKAKANPRATLTKVAALNKVGHEKMHGGHDHKH